MIDRALRVDIYRLNSCCPGFRAAFLLKQCVKYHASWQTVSCVMQEINMKRVAIQGVKGCFHEQAARMFYEGHGVSDLNVVECLTFDNLYRSMDGGEADAAVMAIENTVSASFMAKQG